MWDTTFPTCTDGLFRPVLTTVILFRISYYYNVYYKLTIFSPSLLLCLLFPTYTNASQRKTIITHTDYYNEKIYHTMVVWTILHTTSTCCATHQHTIKNRVGPINMNVESTSIFIVLSRGVWYSCSTRKFSLIYIL